MGSDIRMGTRVPVAVAVVGTGLNPLRLSRLLRLGIMLRYIEGDLGRGVLGVTETSIMV